MNIWALDKDPAIKKLLLRLQEQFGEESFQLVDSQETHRLSVRVTPRDESMHIYLYCYGQSASHYGLHLEFPPSSELPVTQEEAIYDDLPLPRLLSMLSLYLY